MMAYNLEGMVVRPAEVATMIPAGVERNRFLFLISFSLSRSFVRSFLPSSAILRGAMGAHASLTHSLYHKDNPMLKPSLARERN